MNCGHEHGSNKGKQKRDNSKCLQWLLKVFEDQEGGAHSRMEQGEKGRRENQIQ